MQVVDVEFPCDPEPLNSHYYIPRHSIEEQTYQEITRPGCVIRMQAPQKMGKTSLCLRIIDYAQRIGYRPVYIDFQQAESAIFTNLNKFLRWFCANISQKLQLAHMLEEYWDEDIGSKVSCTIYFQNYVLKNINCPIVLILNEVSRIFEYAQISQEFFSLLRSWHEQAKQYDIWQNLRLVVVHSTEVYTALNMNESPFNVGLTVRVPEFNFEEILELSRRYRLNWTDEAGQKNIQSLQNMIGGHPYLLRLALYNLVTFPQKSLEQLLKEAPTQSGIYRGHLRRQLTTLHKYPELVGAFKKVIEADDGVELDHILVYKLESMGLVKLEANRCTVSCELYRQYFANQNLQEQNWQEQIQQLQTQVQELEHLYYTDALTHLMNKRYFNTYLEQHWQNLAQQKIPVSLIVLEIDYFKTYNTTHDQEAGNDCLQQVANVLRQVVNKLKNADSVVLVRYEAAEFAIILPDTKADTALKIAENIRKEVKRLSLLHDESIFGLPASVVTVSLGVACTIPRKNTSPSLLVQAAEEALYQTRINGRDRTSVSSTLNYGLSQNS
ncbi:MAG: AAA-like domain-containing protein [Scytonema sp. PMC 1069.18]|nr:AAA-like domain-containing protein [Scytonema sp. PMC 1069.18]MEC4883055.1 AAA-like domain-containing protein [Scytonema sp. PMC 1070.18]